MTRAITFAQGINEALHDKMSDDPSVIVIGLGVPDPKSIFGTTQGLSEVFGSARVFDMPTSENAVTGVCIGAALRGMRPVMTHQRVDFAFTAMDQMVNQAAKWHYTFAGKSSVPLVIRMVIGRGWGQGPQHSQSPQSVFAHFPGLKVVMPTFPADAKGLLTSAIEDDNPVIFLEHRWLHDISGPVPEGHHTTPLSQARVVKKGTDVSIVAISYMVIEALRAAEQLTASGISAEVIDIRTVSPLDEETILNSVRKTGRLIVADTAARSFGMSAEIIARTTESAWDQLKSPPVRVALPDIPVPTSPALANELYPCPEDLANAALTLFGLPLLPRPTADNSTIPLDVPNRGFTGPF